MHDASAVQSGVTSSERLGRRAAPYILILPSIILAFWIIGYPIWDVANMSLHAVNRFGQLKGFAGFDNFSHLVTEPIFAGCLFRTLIWTVSVVGGTVILSMPIALILNENFGGRRIARIIIMLPWAVSLTMSGIVWRWALDGQSGMVNATLFNLGIIHRPIAWLATAGTAFPVEIFEAAKIDGASPWQEWRYLTFPLLRPFMNIALVLNTIYVFNSFPLIWVMTQGDPANSTDIFVTWLYKLAFRYGKLDVAAALSLVMFLILLSFTIAYSTLAMRDEEESAKSTDAPGSAGAGAQTSAISI